MSEKLERMQQKLNTNFYLDNKDANFTKDVEEFFPEFDKFSQKVKNKIHQMAWDRGHAYGYYQVFNEYYDLVELANMAVSQPRKCNGCFGCIDPCGREQGAEEK